RLDPVVPAREEAEAVLLVVVVPALGHGLEVIERALGAVEDAAARSTYLEAQIDVLEGVAEPAVEAARGLELVAPDDQRGSGHGSPPPRHCSHRRSSGLRAA